MPGEPGVTASMRPASEMAAFEPDDTLRDQLVRIAEQHNDLAAQLDAAHQPTADPRPKPQ
jgi:hypothetical protein